ncbi:hypothetical protein GGF32_007716 [Allomyces javanicus]|nr:hypothetical protein GGF32_007716 [Allomyces javanicus]
MAQHEHFIMVLERVVELLAPFSKFGLDLLTNRFAALPTLDSDEGEESDADEVEKGDDGRDVDAPTVAASPTKQYELPHDFLDALFDAETLFADLNVLLHRVLPA